MTRTYIGLLLVLVGQCVLIAGDSSTQEPEAIARATILEARGVPGEVRPVPLHLTRGKGVEVGSLSITIRFPMELITFERVELGGIAEATGVEAKAEVKKETDHAVVQLAIEAPEQDGVRQSLLDGPLASLYFTIADNAAHKTVIPLVIGEATATGTRAGAAAVKLEMDDGQVVVSAPLITACFFYMH